MFLPRAEVERLTGRVRFAAMRRVLDALGIRYVRAFTGEPLVRPEAIDSRQPAARNRGPRWERLNA